jgi:hypothetical protein
MDGPVLFEAAGDAAGARTNITFRHIQSMSFDGKYALASWTYYHQSTITLCHLGTLSEDDDML